MKIIHTSDWHLGHTLYGYDRMLEQSDFLRQLADIVGEEQPDALVVSGDIYHTPTPSAATQKMYTNAMLEMHRRCPNMSIIVTAGNHDSGSRLEVNSNLWDYVGLRVIGGIERNADNSVNLSKHIIEVKSPQGEKKGYVIAVPHVYPQNFPRMDGNDTTPRQRMSRFFKCLEEDVKSLNTEGLPVVLMAHLSIAGSDRTGHDTVGGIDYYPLEDFGDGYDYLALGHIHCPQTLKGSRGKARYCGTPIPVSFDETYPHSVSIVTLEKNHDPLIRETRIHNPLPLLTLPSQPAGFEEALEALRQFPADKEAYIRLNVQLTGSYLPPDCIEQATSAIAGKACKFCYIKTQRSGSSNEEMTGKQLSIEEIRQKSPLDIARLYYREATGSELEEELECLLMDAIRKEERAGTE